MNKDQFDGRIRQSSGRAKQIAGRVLGDPELELEGRVQQATGRAQKNYGDLKSDLGRGRWPNNRMRPL